MIVSVASGKGGTGKTTVALMLAQGRGLVTLIDCDVEEPNCHLFLNPEIGSVKPVEVSVPYADIDKCTGCGDCVTVCRFAALAVARGKVMIFPELCHSCGGCILACRFDALKEKPRRVGEILRGVGTGFYSHVESITGKMDAGVPSGGPVIRAVKKERELAPSVIVDCPPGTSCAMAQSVFGSDVCLLVTEPNAFGFHDLELAVAVLKEMGIQRFGVVVNKSEPGKWLQTIHAFCLRNQIPLVAEIPYRRDWAVAYAGGVLPDETVAVGRRIWEEVGRLWPV